MKTSLLIVIVMTLIVTGCAPSPVATPEPEGLITPPPVTSTPAGPYTFHVAAGTSDSDWYHLGSDMVSRINESVPNVLANLKETKSLMENVDLLTSGKTGMAFVYDYHVVLANQGRLAEAFPEAPLEKITIKCGTEVTRPMFPEYGEPARIVMPLYEEHLYLVASSTSGIDSVKDLKGKRVSTGEPGSATEQLARFVLRGIGIDEDREIRREQLDLSTALEALRNGQLDAFFWSGAVPDTQLADLLNASQAQVELIPIDGADAQKIIRLYPGVFHEGKISVSGNKEVSTLATTVVLAAMEDFSADHVMQIVSALPFAPETFLTLLPAESQSYLHQGSLDYLLEQGVSE